MVSFTAEKIDALFQSIAPGLSSVTTKAIRQRLPSREPIFSDPRVVNEACELLDPSQSGIIQKEQFNQLCTEVLIRNEIKHEAEKLFQILEAHIEPTNPMLMLPLLPYVFYEPAASQKYIEQSTFLYSFLSPLSLRESVYLWREESGLSMFQKFPFHDSMDFVILTSLIARRSGMKNEKLLNAYEYLDFIGKQNRREEDKYFREYRVNKKAETFFNMAYEYEVLNDIPVAILHAKIAFNLDLKNKTYSLRLGELLLMENNIEEALKLFEVCRKQDPRWKPSLNAWLDLSHTLISNQLESLGASRQKEDPAFKEKGYSSSISSDSN
eukprot:snap_masked-scaffold_13-processed-gene-7.30-mRNA-1 protein AED:0.98 eAED:1.00 QI:0/-1/0/1/-1/1/1/0/324